MKVSLCRVYDPIEPGSPEANATKVLVDRLWPRGVKKSELVMDAWMKDVAPSPELRKWFGHRVENWDEFARLYGAELQEPGRAEAVGRLRTWAAEPDGVVLLYAAKDPIHNHAVVLKRLLEDGEPPSGE